MLKNNAPKSLWSEVVNTANYLVNKLPTQVNQRMTPLQVFIGKKPNLRHLRIFGCKAHVHVPWKIEQSWSQNPLDFLQLAMMSKLKHIGCSI